VTTPDGDGGTSPAVPEALPAVEAVFAGEFYDFEARYTPGMTELVACESGLTPQ